MANLASNQSWWDSEMANELRKLFYQQYYRQNGVLNFLQGQMQNMVKNPTGFSPAALAALRAGAIDTTSNQYNKEQQALNAREFAQGGLDLPSGVNAQINAGLGAQEAQQKAGELNNITLNNEQLKQENYWRGVQGLDTVAAQRNPGSYIADSLDASAGVGPLVNSAMGVNNSSFGHELGSSVASGLGNFLTSYDKPLF